VAHFTIKDTQTKEILLQGPSEAGLHPIYLQQLQSPQVKSKAAFLSSTAFLSHFHAFLGVSAPPNIWHSRLGHPSMSILNKLLQQSLLPCNGPSKINKLCDSCQIAKSKKLSFSDSHRISTHPLELIHSDVWTSPILSLGGCKYYVIFIDDHSRFTWLYPLRNKSDVLPCFVKFKNLVENLFSSSIKQLQTDNGGEYVSVAFKTFIATNVILHRFTCLYTSEHNGISERKHRHITETALTLLAQSHLTPHYWVDAFLTATYLINRLPTPVLHHQSPFLTLFHKQPDYSLLKTFGCACYPLLCPYTPHKLAFHSTKCIFIGYSSTQKGYRCLNLSNNWVYVSRHVIFDELQFPAGERPASSPPTASSPPGIAISIPQGISTPSLSITPYSNTSYTLQPLAPTSAPCSALLPPHSSASNLPNSFDPVAAPPSPSTAVDLSPACEPSPDIDSALSPPLSPLPSLDPVAAPPSPFTALAQSPDIFPARSLSSSHAY